jgi:prepilin-type N-terminal cleavage/methylation domain-containing protein
MRFVLNRRGFTLVELLAVLFVIIAGGAIITAPLRDHTTSMRNQEALETLTKLNGVVDLYRSEFGELPSGGNDAGHHRNVLALLARQAMAGICWNRKRYALNNSNPPVTGIHFALRNTRG